MWPSLCQWDVKKGLLSASGKDIFLLLRKSHSKGLFSLSLVITEVVIYILRSAHGRSVEGARAVTPSVAWLKDLFGGVCCRSWTAHTVGASLCLPDLCHRFDYNFYLRNQEMLLMAWKKSKRFYLILWWKLLVFPPHWMHYSPKTTRLYFLWKRSRFSVTVFHSFL